MRLFLLLSLSSLCVQAAPPQSMAALGDSVSAGVLARYTRKDMRHPWHHFAPMATFARLLMSRDKESLAFRELSWSTGLGRRPQVGSHARRLRELNPYLEVANFAVPSAFSSSVPQEQLPQLRAWSRKRTGQDFPDYVTLFVGVNDLCQKTVQQIPPARQYARQMELSVRTLMDSPNTRLLILPLPRVDRLRAKIAQAPFLGWKGAGIVSTCEQIWRMAPICPTLTDPQQPKDQTRIRRHLHQYNLALHQVVGRARKYHGDRVRLARGIEELELGPDDVSMDCFHPTAQMQHKLAHTAWRSSWWGTMKVLSSY